LSISLLALLLSLFFIILISHSPKLSVAEKQKFCAARCFCQCVGGAANLAGVVGPFSWSIVFEAQTAFTADILISLFPQVSISLVLDIRSIIGHLIASSSIHLDTIVQISSLSLSLTHSLTLFLLYFFLFPTHTHTLSENTWEKRAYYF
jgi:hypothetical protein